MDNEIQDRTGSRFLRIIVRSAIGVMMLGAALGVFAFLEHSRQTPERASSDAPPIVVPVITTRLVDVPMIWEGYGTARALRSSNVASEVAAMVAHRPERIEAGSRVVKGELLVELEAEAFVDRLEVVRGRIAALEAQLDGLVAERESIETKLSFAEERTALTLAELHRVEAAMTSAGVTAVELERQQRELARVRSEEQSLREVLAVWPSRRDRVEAQLTTERAEQRLAEREIENTRVVAPFDGTLQEVRVNIGERVSQGQVVARLVDLSRIEVPIKIAASAAWQIAPDDSVQLIQASQAGAMWDGRVVRIAPEADASTRTITVFVEMNQDAQRAGALLPGQFIMARVTGRGSEPRVVVPRRAVGRDRVLVVVDDGKVEVQAVTIERYIEATFAPIDPVETQWAVVRSGLEPGMKVIVVNAHTVPLGVVVRSVDRAMTDGGAGVTGSAAP